MATSSNDPEKANDDDYNPFEHRNVAHPTTNWDTLTHLVKTALGTGILSMGAAFMESGLILGIFATIAVAIICCHCAYILVKSAHELYKKTKRPSMTFMEVAEVACATGPKWAHKFAWTSRQIVQWGIFLTYFLTCSCYTVIIARNILYVSNQYSKDFFSVRAIIALLLVPSLGLAYVPNLKYLSPFSTLANACMLTGLGITLYYLIDGVPSPSTRPAVVSDVSFLPSSISIIIFAVGCIGLIMPLENHMKTPRSFLGMCGVLNIGISFIATIYTIIGFFGYLRYGEKTDESITYNLPKGEAAAQSVNILIALSVFFSYGLSFFVCLEIAWEHLKDHVTNKQLLYNYILRTILGILTNVIAVAVPTILPFVGLIGSFCFSIVAMMMPIFIEILTFWDFGFGFCYWKIIKDVIILVIATMALITGSTSAIIKISKLFY